jgi:hypothetical protein
VCKKALDGQVTRTGLTGSECRAASRADSRSQARLWVLISQNRTSCLTIRFISAVRVRDAPYDRKDKFCRIARMTLSPYRLHAAAVLSAVNLASP